MKSSSSSGSGGSDSDCSGSSSGSSSLMQSRRCRSDSSCRRSQFTEVATSSSSNNPLPHLCTTMAKVVGRMDGIRATALRSTEIILGSVITACLSLGRVANA